MGDSHFALILLIRYKCLQRLSELRYKSYSTQSMDKQCTVLYVHFCPRLGFLFVVFFQFLRCRLLTDSDE